MLKVGVLGNSDVGKSSLTQKFQSPDYVLGPKFTTYYTDTFNVYLTVN